MPDNEYTTTERVAIVAHLLATGEQLTTADVANLVGVTRCGAWEMLSKLSRVLPLVQERTSDNRSIWYSIE